MQPSRSDRFGGGRSRRVVSGGATAAADAPAAEGPAPSEAKWTLPQSAPSRTAIVAREPAEWALTAAASWALTTAWCATLP